MNLQICIQNYVKFYIIFGLCMTVFEKITIFKYSNNKHIDEININ